MNEPTPEGASRIDEQDQSVPCTVRQMKELMASMQENINQNKQNDR